VKISIKFGWPKLWSPSSSQKENTELAQSVVSSFKALKCHEFSELLPFKEALDPKDSVTETAGKILEFLKKHKERLEKCREIFFISNELSTVALEVLQYFSSVEKITFIYNSLRTLPRELGDLKKLKTLQIIHTNFDDVTSICHLTGLEHLVMNQNKFKELPPELGDLTNLKTLSCGGNRMTALPSTIAQLKDLEELRLSGNHFDAVPSVVFRLRHLRILDLSWNPLTYLPEGEEPIRPGYRLIAIPGNERHGVQRKTLLVHSII